MAMIMNRLLAISCLLLLAGCVTDKLVVYKDSVLSEKDMRPFLASYKVEKWPGDNKPETVRVAGKKGKHHFTYTTGEKKIKVRFLVSKIPGSKTGLHLLSLPAQKDTNQANLFFIGRAKKDQTDLWIVFSNMPVAKGRLEFENGKAKAEDVKKFLSKHADAFVKENKSTVTLRREKS